MSAPIGRAISRSLSRFLGGTRQEPRRVGKFDGKAGPLYAVLAALWAAPHSRVAGDGDSLSAVGGAELEQDGGHVVLHRFHADAHPG
jgi:hypothetical protein